MSERATKTVTEKGKTMKPIDNYEAERAFKEGKQIFVLNRATAELTDLTRVRNRSAIVEAFTRPENIFYARVR